MSDEVVKEVLIYLDPQDVEDLARLPYRVLVATQPAHTPEEGEE